VGDGLHGLTPFGSGEGFDDVEGFFGLLGGVCDVFIEGEFGVKGDAENFGFRLVGIRVLFMVRDKVLRCSELSGVKRVADDFSGLSRRLFSRVHV